MTPRERLQTVLAGGIPDRVPVAPDFSNMIPARRTGKPFWQLYLYHDPPIWQAYVDCAEHFGIDSLMDGYCPLRFPQEQAGGGQWQECIVRRDPDRIVTQRSRVDGGRRRWQLRVDVYFAANPPWRGVDPVRLGLPPTPARWEPVERQPLDVGPEAFKRCKQRLGDRGLMGAFVVGSCVLASERDFYDYCDHPDKYERLADERVERAERRFHRVMALDDETRPDFLCVGGSGSLVFQTLEIFDRLAFPAVRRVIELADRAGMPTHVHCCGPERQLVRLFAEQTALTVIDPLEPPPMGDCDLAELKRLYGHQITLKGNLHTTDVMLRGSAADVKAAAVRCFRDAARGGRYILSTGDQCGRDTPDENLFALVEAAAEFGRYDRSTGELPDLPA